MKDIAALYSIKVWLSTSILGSIIVLLCILVDWGVHVPEEVFSMLLLIILFSMVLSIPSWLLLLFSAKFIVRTGYSGKVKRLFLLAISWVLCAAPLIYFLHPGQHSIYKDLIFFVPYFLVLSASVLLYKLEEEEFCEETIKRFLVK